MAAESVWQKILAADGIPVPDVAFRHSERLASMEKKVSPTKHQLQLPVMHHDLRPAMESFIRRGDDKATDESVDFTLSLLRIAEATVDTKIGTQAMTIQMMKLTPRLRLRCKFMKMLHQLMTTTRTIKPRRRRRRSRSEAKEPKKVASSAPYVRRNW